MGETTKVPRKEGRKKRRGGGQLRLSADKTKLEGKKNLKRGRGRNCKKMGNGVRARRPTHNGPKREKTLRRMKKVLNRLQNRGKRLEGFLESGEKQHWSGGETP